MKDEGPTDPAITIVGNPFEKYPTSGNPLSNKSGPTYVWQPTLALIWNNISWASVLLDPAGGCTWVSAFLQLEPLHLKTTPLSHQALLGDLIILKEFSQTCSLFNPFFNLDKDY